MKGKTTPCALLTVTTLCATSCGTADAEKSIPRFNELLTVSELKGNPKYNGARVRVGGEPVSVVTGTTEWPQGGSAIAVMIREGDKFLLGSNSDTYRSDVIRAGAIFQSEKDDDDEQDVILYGVYKSGELHLERVKANGYSRSLRE